MNKRTGEIYEIDCYKYKNDIVSIIYSPKTDLLKVEGRLVNLMYSSNKVFNFDDYISTQFDIIYQEDEVIEYDDDYLRENSWYEIDDEGIDMICFPSSIEYIPRDPIIIEERLEQIIKSINRNIYELIGVRVNVLTFRVTYLEVCFNIWLNKDYVDRYIELFNLIYDDKADKRYINYIKKNDLQPFTSFYVKPKSQYRDNVNSNYTVNFYNKENQLQYVQKSPKYKYNITKDDLKTSERVLRLEIQLGYHYLNKICKDNGLDRVFKEFINLELCTSIIIDKYRFFISNNEQLSFFSYKKAKEIIQNTELLKHKDKKNLLRHIREKYQYNKNHNYVTRKRYKDMLEKLGIHYYFIPSKWEIDYLESPIKLLTKKNNDIEEERLNYKRIISTFSIEDYYNGFCTLEDLPNESRGIILEKKQKQESKKYNLPF